MRLSKPPFGNIADFSVSAETAHTTFVVYKCALVINKGKFIEQACIKSGIYEPLLLPKSEISNSDENLDTRSARMKCALVPREAEMLVLQNSFFKNYYADFRESVYPVSLREDCRKQF